MAMHRPHARRSTQLEGVVVNARELSALRRRTSQLARGTNMFATRHTRCTGDRSREPQQTTRRKKSLMSDFETIDSTALELVNGGAIPLKPIIKGVEKGAELVEKGYKAAKPYVKKAIDGLNIVGNLTTVGNAIHDGWNYMFGSHDAPPKPEAPKAPQPQAQGSN
jgi:hypothetical protein